MARNILGTELIECSIDPMTGFYRNGKCDTCGDDAGQHSVCAQMTDSFLEFSASCGNDLITPMPDYKFPGLKAGDFGAFALAAGLRPTKLAWRLRSNLRQRMLRCRNSWI